MQGECVSSASVRTGQLSLRRRPFVAQENSARRGAPAFRLVFEIRTPNRPAARPPCRKDAAGQSPRWGEAGQGQKAFLRREQLSRKGHVAPLSRARCSCCAVAGVGAASNHGGASNRGLPPSLHRASRTRCWSTRASKFLGRRRQSLRSSPKDTGSCRLLSVIIVIAHKR